MLVLSRKQNETIIVGESIQITVCHVAGGKVKLGLQAPPGVRILRGELASPEQRQMELAFEPSVRSI